MSTTSLTHVFRELFTAPLSAVTQSESDYRQIWAQWLEDQLRLLVKENGQLREGVDLAKVLDTAPVVDLDGVIEMAVTMRIASVKEFQASVEGGVGVGPIFVSGGFGFVNRSSQESVFQASTRVTMSNSSKNLVEYLADHNIPLTDVSEVTNAIQILKQSPLSNPSSKSTKGSSASRKTLAKK